MRTTAPAPAAASVPPPVEALAGASPVAGAAPATPAPAITGADVHYGGFWRRFLAIFIDGCILNLATLPFGVGLWTAMAGLNQTGPDPDKACGVLAGGIMIWVARALASVLYPALFESSAWQASPGKKLLGLRVTDLKGQRISFWRALARTLGKGLSGMLLGFGFIMAAFTKQKQGLHDLLADTIVVRT